MLILITRPCNLHFNFIKQWRISEKGLACAGLNFPDYIKYEPNAVDGKNNVAPYDVIFWILSNFSSIEELREPLNNLNIVEKSFDATIPLPTLHWIIKDKTGVCLVVEAAKDKLRIID